MESTESHLPLIVIDNVQKDLLEEDNVEMKNDFTTPALVIEYLTDILSEIQKVNSDDTDTIKLIDNKIISSQTFRIFLSFFEKKICDNKNLNESLIYAKSIITFIAQKIQNFMQFLPNTLSAILLILVDIGSKNNGISSFLTTLADRVERVCSTSNFVSSILYRYNTKNINSLSATSTLTTNSATKRKNNFLKSKIDHIDLKTLIIEFENSGEIVNGGLIGKIINLFIKGKLTEVQLNNMLEQYCIFYPQLFLSLSCKDSDEAFSEEVFVLFSSNCSSVFNLIAQITVYSSVSTIQKVMNELLREFKQKLVAQSVINFVENAVTANSMQCYHLPTPEQTTVLFDYVLNELLSQHLQKEAEPSNSNSTTNSNIIKTKTDRTNRKFLIIEKNKKAKQLNESFQQILDQFIRILSAIFKKNEIETYIEQEYENENGRQTLKALRRKVAYYETKLKHYEILDNERKQKLRLVEHIAETIDNKFPGFSRNTISLLSSNLLSVTSSESNLLTGCQKRLLRPVELLTINDFDNILHRAINDLFSLITNDFYSNKNIIRLTVKQTQLQTPTMLSETTTDLITEIMKNLIQEAKLKPHVLARQIPLISINVSNLIQKIAKQFRDSILFIKILELTPDIIYNSYPHSMKDTVSIELIFQAYLTFFETYGFRRAWSNAVDRLLLCFLKLLEINLILSQKLLFKNAGIIQVLVSKTSMRVPGVIALAESIPTNI